MKQSPVLIRGELALLVIVVINSLGVVLMLYSGSGISAISSVPYAFSEVLPALSLGTWTYIFQGLLVLSLMLLRKRFVPQYLLSFVVGFAFGLMIDVHEIWISELPQTLPLRVLYFVLSYLIICLGIALSNRCKMPIIPTDLFPREVSAITGADYARVKIPFDVICLLITGIMTWVFLGEIRGLGIGTILAAFTMGKVIDFIGQGIDKHFVFTSVFEA
ncbi:MAG: DUF6198 family protein [Eubacterium sp.]|nr:DUF6198 family protein [Eubacterium sp.]